MVKDFRPCGICTYARNPEEHFWHRQNLLLLNRRCLRKYSVRNNSSSRVHSETVDSNPSFLKKEKERKKVYRIQSSLCNLQEDNIYITASVRDLHRGHCKQNWIFFTRPNTCDKFSTSPWKPMYLIVPQSSKSSSSGKNVLGGLTTAYSCIFSFSTKNRGTAFPAQKKKKASSLQQVELLNVLMLL